MKKSVNERWANQRFGRLYIVNAWVDGGITRANCVCDCGTKFSARAADLKSKNTSSCGCYRVENTIQMKRTHGETETPLYKIWSDIKKRCNNPNSKAYRNYGARGIKISQEWENDYLTFKADIGERPSPDHEIDRIDNDGDYRKGNCRWVTHTENMKNTRAAIRVDYRGRKMPLKDVSELSGVPYLKLYYRVKNGKPLFQ